MRGQPSASTRPRPGLPVGSTSVSLGVRPRLLRCLRDPRRWDSQPAAPIRGRLSVSGVHAWLACTPGDKEARPSVEAPQYGKRMCEGLAPRSATGGQVLASSSGPRRTRWGDPASGRHQRPSSCVRSRGGGRRGLALPSGTVAVAGFVGVKHHTVHASSSSDRTRARRPPGRRWEERHHSLGRGPPGKPGDRDGRAFGEVKGGRAPREGTGDSSCRASSVRSSDRAVT